MNETNLCTCAECGCLPPCFVQESCPDEDDFFRLIDAMSAEIRLLEAEIVRTRHVLIQYLPERWADGLYEDIFSNLSACFMGNYKEYDRYVRHCYGGADPMESDEHTAQLLRLRDGTDVTTYHHLLPGNR